MNKLPLLLSLLMLSACQVASPLAGPPLGVASPPSVANELILRFNPGTTAQTKRALRQRFGATSVQTVMADGERWTLPETDVSTTVAKLESDPSVKFAQPNDLRHLELPQGTPQALPLPNFSVASFKVLDSVPNDPDYSQQWELPVDGFPSVWNRTTGAGVIVGVIDSGVDPSHPDLQANLLPLLDEVVAMGNHDTVLNGINFDGKDGHGHGTHVTGIIAAVQNNGIGVTGAAPGVKVLPVKVTTADGNADDATISKGIVDAVDHGAQVLNLSIGGTQPSPILLDALNYAFNKNVVVVIASGNDGQAVNYPAAYAGVISVGATTSKGKIAYYSSRGPNLVMVAPGGSPAGGADGIPILSTTPTYPCWITINEGNTTSYGQEAGTSMAAPQVTAAAALLLSLYPGLSPAQLRTRLAATASHPNGPGFDQTFGFGVLNVPSALNDQTDDGRSAS